jgi:hypothetical protein
LRAASADPNRVRIESETGALVLVSNAKGITCITRKLS